MNTNLKVFIVEDNTFFANLLQEEISRNGHHDIQTFTSAESCLDELWKVPQVIFMDYELTNMNGVEALRKIMSFDPDIQVVFLSGQDSMHVALETLKFGAFDYIVKDDRAFERVAQVLNTASKIQDIIQREKTNQKWGIARKIGTVLAGFIAGAVVGVQVL
jgi:DNA-binding NtrC family response regulator